MKSGPAGTIQIYEGFEFLLNENVSGIDFAINQSGNTSYASLYAVVQDTSTGDSEIVFIENRSLTGGGQNLDNLSIVTDDLLDEFDWDGDGLVGLDDLDGEDGVLVLNTLDSFDLVTTMFAYTVEDGMGGFESDLGGNARIKEINLVQQDQLSDLQFSVIIQGVDGDGDLTAPQTINYAIDGDDDGLFIG